MVNAATENVAKEPDGRLSNIATTILARDYKGLSDFGANGVIEIYEVTDEQNKRIRPNGQYE